MPTKDTEATKPAPTGGHLTIKLPIEFSDTTRRQIKAGQPHVGEDSVREYLANLVTEHADVGRFVARRLEEHYRADGVPLVMEAPEPTDVDVSAITEAGK